MLKRPPLPVVNNPVDHHPLRLDAISVVLVLQDGILGVLSPPLLTLSHSILVLSARPIIQTRRLVHVRLPLVVSVHHGVEDLQLGAETEVYVHINQTLFRGNFKTMVPPKPAAQ